MVEEDGDGEDDGEEEEVESALRGPADVGIVAGWSDDDDEDAFGAGLVSSALDADPDDASPAPRTAPLIVQARRSTKTLRLGWICVLTSIHVWRPRLLHPPARSDGWQWREAAL